MSQKLLQCNLDTPGTRLRRLRAVLELTRDQIQKRHKLPEITLKCWENGKKITEKGAKRCAAIYKAEGLMVDENWLLHGKGLDPIARRSLGEYFAMPSDAKLPPEDEFAMVRDAEDFKSKYPESVVMIVSNDEMSPLYKPGDYVGGRCREAKELYKLANKDCIIFLNGGGQHFRRVYRDSIGRYNLSCLNPIGNAIEPVIFNADIKCAAPVIWVRRKDE